jgi:1-acyl-sn-glycerol-3-phosphate acyltransferase
MSELPPGSWPWLAAFARWLGSWIFHLVYRYRVHGRDRVPPTGPVLVVANHSSFLDGPMIFGALGRPAVFLIKQEMFRGPLRVVLPRIGQLAIRQHSAHREPLLAAVRVLREGGLVGVFPEGHRGAGDVTDAQNGAAWLARTSGAVVLPIAVRGTRKALTGKGFRRRVDVLIGEPVSTSTRRGRTGLAEATEQVRMALATLVSDLDRLRDGLDAPRGAAGMGEHR